jgi:hypothetical protein
MATPLRHPEPERGGGLAPWWGLMVAASVALVACVWSVPYIPTNDGPQVALASHIQNHYADPDSIFPGQVVPNFTFTHLGFSLVFTPLEAVLPWRDALRISLSVGALGMAWAFAWLVAAVDPRRRPLGLLGFAFAMTWSFYMGFFSYEIATALGLALVGLAVRVFGRRPVGAMQSLLVGTGLFAVAVAHVFAAAWTGLAVLAVLLARAPAEERLREVGRGLLVGAPSMALFAAAWSQHEGLARVAMTSSFTWVPLSEQAVRLPRLLLPGPHARAWIAAVLVGAALVGVLARWRKTSPIERALAALALTLLGLAALAPLDVPGWQFFSPRFLAPVPALAVALIPFERIGRPRARRLALGAVAGTTFASLLVSGALHRRLFRGCADVLSGLDDTVRRSSYVLPIVLDPYCGMDRSPDRSEVPYLAPARHLGALYALAQGGSIPYLFAGSSAAYAFRLRDAADGASPRSIPNVERYWSAVESEPFRDDGALRERIVTELAVHGTSYEAVIAFGAQPRDVAVFDRMGYVPERANGSLLVAKFRGCHASLRMSAAVAREAIRFEWGSSSLVEPLVDRVLPPAPAGTSGDLVLPIPRILCGDVWFRLSRALDATGRALASPCAGADSNGRIRATLSADEPRVIACDAPAAAPE